MPLPHNNTGYIKGCSCHYCSGVAMMNEWGAKPDARDWKRFPYGSFESLDSLLNNEDQYQSSSTQFDRRETQTKLINGV